MTINGCYHKRINKSDQTFCDPERSTHHHNEVFSLPLSLKSNLNLIKPPDLNTNIEKKTEGSVFK